MKIGIIFITLILLAVGCTDTQSQMNGLQNTSSNPISDCDQRATDKYNEWNTAGINTKHDSFHDTIFITYHNRYDSVNNSCYVLLGQSWHTSSSDKTGIGKTVTAYNFFDFNRKDKYGNYMAIGSYMNNSYDDGQPPRLDDCNVLAQECGSLDGFNSLVNPYLYQ